MKELFKKQNLPLTVVVTLIVAGWLSFLSVIFTA